jgi:hypothetical protein
VLFPQSPNCSWGIVQAQPTYDTAALIPKYPQAVGGLFSFNLRSANISAF